MLRVKYDLKERENKNKKRREERNIYHFFHSLLYIIREKKYFSFFKYLQVNL